MATFKLWIRLLIILFLAMLCLSSCEMQGVAQEFTISQLKIWALIGGVTVIITLSFIYMLYNRKLKKSWAEVRAAYQDLRLTHEQVYLYQSGFMTIKGQSIRLKDIIWIEVDGNNTSFFLEKEVLPTIVPNFSMKKTIEQLPSKWFMRISKNEAVNLDAVISIKGATLTLSNQKQLLFSPVYKTTLFEELKHRGITT